MQFPIIIGLRRSRFLDISVLIAGLMASIAILAFSANYLVQIALLSIIWLIAFLAFRKLKPRLRSLRLERAGYVFAARTEEAEFVRMELEPISTVHPWLTVIRLNDESGVRNTLLIAADTLKADDFRRLRVFIRWQKNADAPADDA